MASKITDNALDLLKRRYFRAGETCWEDLCKRVAKCIAEAEETKEDKEKWEKVFYRHLVDLDFIPNSPLLMNAGTEMKQYSACFSVKTEDNIESIFKAFSDAALISKSGGGCGFNFSNIRPKGDPVGSTDGVASGPLSWARIQDTATDVVKQGGRRRGANILLLDVSHPDIEEFITAKDDGVSFTNFNFSVVIPDAFMDAVKNDAKWDLVFNGKVYKTVRAKYLWDMICEHAWSKGEPGLYFIDTVNRNNPAPWLGRITNVNPCLHKDTYLVTENGLEKISNLKSKIWNGQEYVQSNAWKTGNKKVYRIMTNSGFEYIATPNHKFMLEDGTWENAINLIGKNIKFDLAEKEWIGINPYPGTDYKVLGFIFGDGGYHKASNRMKYIYANPQKDKEVINLIEYVFGDSFYPKTKGKSNINNVINIPCDTVYANAFKSKIDDRIIPDWILQLPKQEMRDFLCGLFSANGTNLKKYHKIQLVSINKNMLMQVQQMLLLFGIKSKLWYHNKSKEIIFNNGQYECKQSSHLVISRKSYKKFITDIGFMQAYKNEYDDINYKEEYLCETVILISELDEAEVWDFSEPNLHQGITNGAFIHNCGEIPMIDYEACSLASINLVNFTDAKSKSIKWKELAATVHHAIRFLDNLITVSEFPIPEIEKTVKANRKIGLGIMGLADALYLMDAKYDSNDGVKLAGSIMEFINDIANAESNFLATERGVYPAGIGCDNRRNAAVTSIQPTGSVSMIAGVSSGCEPNFALVYNRYSESLNTNYYIVNPIFKAKLEEYGLYSDTLLQKIVDNGGSIQDMVEIPQEIRSVFVTTNDISPEWHIRMQACLQKHVQSGISKTINAPEDDTVENVQKAFMMAYDLGCKGITYYRNNSRAFQPLTVSKNKQTDSEYNDEYIIPRHRPQTAVGFTSEYAVGCGKLYITLNFDENGDLLETFVNTGATGVCAGFAQGLSRMVSTCLRANVDPKYVIKQLRSVSCPNCRNKNVDAKSCPDAFGQVLLKGIGDKSDVTENIIPDSSKAITLPPKDEPFVGDSRASKLCECGHEWKYMEGCKTCPACGASKCG